MPIHGQTLQQIITSFAPRRYALEGDRTGLQVGCLDREISSVMVTLDTTLDVVHEAIYRRAQLIVSHHAVVFRPLDHLRTSDPKGKLLELLIKNDIAVYVPHTAMDVASGGGNDRLAAKLGLQELDFLRETGRDEAALVVVPKPEGDGVLRWQSTLDRKLRSVGRALKKETGQAPWSWDLTSGGVARGIGRIGTLPEPISLEAFGRLVQERLDAPLVRRVGEPERKVQKVAVLCGDGNRFVRDAVRRGADVLVTGDVYYHTALEAQALGIALLDPGHNASERLVGEVWKEVLEAGLAERQAEDVEVFVSSVPTEPFALVGAK